MNIKLLKKHSLILHLCLKCFKSFLIIYIVHSQLFYSHLSVPISWIHNAKSSSSDDFSSVELIVGNVPFSERLGHTADAVLTSTSWICIFSVRYRGILRIYTTRYCALRIISASTARPNGMLYVIISGKQYIHFLDFSFITKHATLQEISQKLIRSTKQVWWKKILICFSSNFYAQQ